MSSKWIAFDYMAEAGMLWTAVTLAVVITVVCIWIMVELWSMPEPGPRSEAYFEEDDADG